MASADIEFRCFVGGLAWATTDLSLSEAFSPYGEIVESKIINDRETGRSRGFGFVTFRDEKAMRDAIEGMNGQNLDGRNITVNEAQYSSRSGGASEDYLVTKSFDFEAARAPFSTFAVMGFKFHAACNVAKPL
ncbi:hypothetical protein JRO89_XS02G0045400 [Xanthoceras sorbifolium]|uniref:RRM domain-containing protein n=1 Tax=Xanthoceras sorbifolium TaxID=99658 RepID=A0ABQ8IEH3_9ROSI|nr:hypothetical protein JRO89_XS02G0045400 [Xanthoceras sorbifolium]